MPKRILIVAHNFPPLGSGGVHRPVKFARYLAALGWEVEVLTVKPIRYHAYDPSLLDEIPAVTIHRTESLEPLRLMWLAGWRPSPLRRGTVASFADFEDASAWVEPVPRAGRVYRRIASFLFQPDEQWLWVPFARAAAASLYRRKGYDLIFTTSPPESCHFVGEYIRKVCGVPWVADFRDAWATHHLRRGVPSLPLHKRWERRIVLAASGIIANTDEMASYFAATTGRSDVIVIPNGYDDADRGFPLPKARGDDFVLVHNGSFRGGRRALPLLEGFARAREEAPGFREHARLYLIGINRSDDVAAAKEMGLEDSAFFVPYTAHRDAVRACLGADGLVLCMASCEGPALIPGKLYEYLGTGVRIIASVPEGQARRLLERATRGALIVPAEDAAALAAAFVNAYNEKALGLTNYRTVEEEVRAYARPCQVERLAAFLGKWT